MGGGHENGERIKKSSGQLRGPEAAGTAVPAASSLEQSSLSTPGC